MAYLFQDRLQHNRQRFAEINAKAVTYKRIDPAASEPISVSPIKHRAKEDMSYAPSFLRADIQCFGIDVSVLQAVNLWPPIDSDTIEYPDGQVFRVIKKDENEPMWDFTTSSQDRILLYTQAVKGPNP